MREALVFGARGALGSAVVDELQERHYRVHTLGHDKSLVALDTLPGLDAVVWAQGINGADSIADGFSEATYTAIMEANVTFVARSMAQLLKTGRINNPGRFCVLSSIWQDQARTNKFSYTISKAAVGGLVRSCAGDLGSRGILINAVLPGVVDTPMTRKNLSSEQIDRITGASALGHLATPKDIATTVAFLIGPENRSITAQSLAVDAGFSLVRGL
jgi:NAD(P)-dependent dehydrogenase (short-subunit alcohol dehydrogenase family)